NDRPPDNVREGGGGDETRTPDGDDRSGADDVRDPEQRSERTGARAVLSQARDRGRDRSSPLSQGELQHHPAAARAASEARMSYAGWDARDGCGVRMWMRIAGMAGGGYAPRTCARSIG